MEDVDIDIHVHIKQCKHKLSRLSLLHRLASVWLTCHAVECTIQVTPPGGFKTTELKFSRRQLVKSQPIKVDKDNNFVRIDTGPQMHHYSAQARKKKRKNKGGPDIDGNYDSYTVVLRPPIVNEDLEDESGQYETDLSSLEQFTEQEEGTENRVLAMRKYNFGQTKRRTRTMTSKLDSYIQQRRHQLVIKENASLSWKGVLAMVFGIFFLLLTFLIGQFFEEENSTTRGPGTRRTTVPKRKTRKNVPGKYS